MAGSPEHNTVDGEHQQAPTGGQAGCEPPRHAEDEGDSEWEYEYDTNQKETFYVTLDLSSSLGPLRSTRKRRASEAHLEHTRERGQSGSTPNDEVSSEGPDEDVGDGITDASDPAISRIQIMDLNGPSPLVSYDGQIYSCEWSRTLGTELLFAAPGSALGDASLPMLQSTSKYDLLAATSLRLTSTPAQLVSRREPRREEAETRPSEDVGDEAVPPPAVSIPVDPQARRERQDQARFLERLMAVKDARGERDEVTVFAKKRMTGTGWRAQQRLRLETERDDLMSRMNDGDEEAALRLAELEINAQGPGEGPGASEGFSQERTILGDGSGTGVSGAAVADLGASSIGQHAAPEASLQLATDGASPDASTTRPGNG